MKGKIKLVLVQNCVSDTCISVLNLSGIQTVRKAEVSIEDEQIHAYDALVVGPKTHISSDILNAMKRLKVIAVAAPDLGRIDVEEASKNNIIVINAPNATIISVSELICALVLAVAKQLRPARATFADGNWKYGIFKGENLKGRTVAIIGCGKVSRDVASRLSAFNMKIVGFDPMMCTPIQGFDKIVSDLDDIWPIADYVLLLDDYAVFSVIGFDPFASEQQCLETYYAKITEIYKPSLVKWVKLHENLIQTTDNFIDANVFARCKTGVKIINVGRRGLINEADLLSAVNSGKIGGVAIDVLEGPQTDPTTLALLDHPSVLATPNIATSTSDIPMHAAKEVAEQIVNLVMPGTYEYTKLSEVDKMYANQ